LWFHLSNRFIIVDFWLIEFLVVIGAVRLLVISRLSHFDDLGMFWSEVTVWFIGIAEWVYGCPWICICMLCIPYLAVYLCFVVEPILLLLAEYCPVLTFVDGFPMGRFLDWLCVVLAECSLFRLFVVYSILLAGFWIDVGWLKLYVDFGCWWLINMWCITQLLWL
jgi:hypothetical protein